MLTSRYLQIEPRLMHVAKELRFRVGFKDVSEGDISVKLIPATAWLCELRYHGGCQLHLDLSLSQWVKGNVRVTLAGKLKLT